MRNLCAKKTKEKGKEEEINLRADIRYSNYICPRLSNNFFLTAVFNACLLP